MERVLTRNIEPGRGPVSLEDYERGGGYQGLRKALTMEPGELVKLVWQSGLRGRGGAGFSTGFKWSAMPPVEGSGRPRYIVCNFDEMEPGTFKDRFLVEGDPHQLLEGILIAAHACQADAGYVFVRDEYRLATAALRRAIAEAGDRGLLGESVLGSGWSFLLHIHASAGRYMCGEETGLLNALEGGRANPRAKPPYPQASGAWGRPTVVQNVETLSCVPHIVERGDEWFRSLGKAKDSGTKMYGVSGKVNRPGCWELPMGTTMRELLEEHADGMKEGCAFRAALPGGESTRFLGPDLCDTPLDYETLSEKGLLLGTGTVIVLDDRTCPVAAARNLQTFYVRESCGWCTPCRDGLPWVLDIIEDIEQGRGRHGDVDLLLEMEDYLGPNAFCAFALGAIQPLVSLIEMFRDEFEEHINKGRCPYER